MFRKLYNFFKKDNTDLTKDVSYWRSLSSEELMQYLHHPILSQDAHRINIVLWERYFEKEGKK